MKEKRMKETKQGTIVTLQKEKHYGFIKPDEAGQRSCENIFFHFENMVEGQDLNSLSVGDVVEYFEEEVQKGKQACEVVVMFHIDFVE
ncbi:cold-shock protein [Anaerosporobacter sp.]